MIKIQTQGWFLIFRHYQGREHLCPGDLTFVGFHSPGVWLHWWQPVIKTDVNKADLIFCVCVCLTVQKKSKTNYITFSNKTFKNYKLQYVNLGVAAYLTIWWQTQKSAAKVEAEECQGLLIQFIPVMTHKPPFRFTHSVLIVGRMEEKCVFVLVQKQQLQLPSQQRTERTTSISFCSQEQEPGSLLNSTQPKGCCSEPERLNTPCFCAT